MFKNYVRDRKILGFVEVINMLDDEQKATQRDVDKISHAFRWIGMDVKLPHLNLKDEELKSTIAKVLITFIVCIIFLCVIYYKHKIRI
jgi:hypothetical protein